MTGSIDGVEGCATVHNLDTKIVSNDQIKRKEALKPIIAGEPQIQPDGPVRGCIKF